MSVTFQILGSSSAGNSALLCTPQCRILIDAGFSARKLGEMLEGAGLKLKDLDAVFLTHEHGDHASGLSGLAKLPKLKVFANRGTATAIGGDLAKKLTWQLFETGTAFHFCDLEVTTFSIPHDATEPVGYLFKHGTGEDLFSPVRRIAWVTDLGYVPQLVQQRVREADVLVLEANYDTDLLDRDEKRPWTLKQRIKGRHGHLSNEAAAQFLGNTPGARWRHVYLAHLSRECNDVDLVEALFSRPETRPNGCNITVVHPDAGPQQKYAFTGW